MSSKGALRGSSYCRLEPTIPLTCAAELMAATWEIKNTNVVCVPTHERFKAVIPAQLLSHSLQQLQPINCLLNERIPV